MLCNEDKKNWINRLIQMWEIKQIVIHLNEFSYVGIP